MTNKTTTNQGYSAGQLIHAIQSLDVDTLQTAVNDYLARYRQETKKARAATARMSTIAKGTPANECFDYSPLNCFIQIGDARSMSVTPLHVACKAYAHYRHTPAVADCLDRMIQILLDGGASPYMRAAPAFLYKNDFIKGRFGRHPERVSLDNGPTPLQCCDGHVPPSLAAWVQEDSKSEYGNRPGNYKASSRNADNDEGADLADLEDEDRSYEEELENTWLIGVAAY